MYIQTKTVEDSSPERKRKPNNAFIFLKKFTLKMMAKDVSIQN